MLSILLLEDDLVLLESLADELEDEGYNVDRAKHGKELLDLTYSKSYDLYILDINVPYVDGLTLLTELRASNDITPAIFLTSKNTESDMIAGFEAKCDDYLVKPFQLYELKLRIGALLRRTTKLKLLYYDEIAIDIERNILKIKDETCVLDKKALEILALFVAHPNTVFTMDQIIDEVYQDKIPSHTVVRVHISKINALFQKKRIINLRGVGYRYENF